MYGQHSDIYTSMLMKQCWKIHKKKKRKRKTSHENQK